MATVLNTLGVALIGGGVVLILAVGIGMLITTMFNTAKKYIMSKFGIDRLVAENIATCVTIFNVGLLLIVAGLIAQAV